MTLLLVLAGCAKAPPQAASPAGDGPAGDLDTLVAWLTGAFDSRALATADDRFLDLTLSACPVRWGTARQAVYLELAPSEAPLAPSWQRLFLVGPAEVGIRIEVYALADPATAVGACADPAAFDRDAPASRLEGCALGVAFTGDAYSGSTRGRSCAGRGEGVAWTSSELRVEAGRVFLWDRAFDADGIQVAGPETGAYELRRR